MSLIIDVKLVNAFSVGREFEYCNSFEVKVPILLLVSELLKFL